MCLLWYGNSRRLAAVQEVGGPGSLPKTNQRLMATSQGSATGSDTGQTAKFICVPSVLSPCPVGGMLVTTE